MISIVIPAFNAASHLAETLDSVRQQTHTNWECVVVDDGSTDATASIARSCGAGDGRMRCVGQANRGVAAARNRGAAETKTTAAYLIFLDADDVWQPDALQTLKSAIETHRDAVAVHGSGSYIDDDGAAVRTGQLENRARYRLRFDGCRVVPSGPGEPTSFWMLATACSIQSPGMVLIRREAFDALQGFDEGLHLTEDWDMWVRLSRMSDIPFVDRPVLCYRQHGANSSSIRKVAVRNVARARRKILSSRQNTKEQRRFAQRAYRGFYWFMACARARNGVQMLRAGRVRPAVQDLRLGTVNLLMAMAGRPLNLLLARA